MGPRKGAVIDREEFEQMMDGYYVERGWDAQTTRPSDEKLKALGLGFAIARIGV